MNLKKNLYIKFLKPIMWRVFYFMFYALHFAILNLTRVSKIKKTKLFPSFFQPSHLKRPSIEKLTSKHLDGVFEMLIIRGLMFAKNNLILLLQPPRNMYIYISYFNYILFNMFILYVWPFPVTIIDGNLFEFTIAFIALNRVFYYQYYILFQRFWLHDGLNIRAITVANCKDFLFRISCWRLKKSSIKIF